MENIIRVIRVLFLCLKYSENLTIKFFTRKTKRRYYDIQELVFAIESFKIKT